MERVIVVGPPGSGKTTIAARIADRLGHPHTELDSLWWEPNWTEAGAEAFRSRVDEVTAAPRWVIDGNYFSVGAEQVAWPRADTIVWLDLGRWLTVGRVVRRTTRRAVRRTELWNGNRESLRLALRPDSLVLYAIRNHPKYNRRYASLADDASLDHLTWVRLPTRRAVRRWLRSLD